MIPRLVALADVLAVFAYLAGVTPIAGQAAGLAIKLLLLPMMLRGNSILMRRSEALFVLAATCLLALVLSPDTELLDVVQIIGFLAHLSLTLLLLRRELGEYFRAIAILVAPVAVLYVLMAFAGMIPTVHGRFWYFHELHPNLGAEIAAAAAICAAISVRYKPFVALSLIFLSNAVLMEGRSAILTITLILVLRSLHEAFVASDSSKVQFRIILATPVAVVLGMLALPYLMQAMMLDDRYRGVGTGFVGRTEQWEIAWEAFLDRPLAGQGFGWFERTQDLGAHNFFLYGLAEMGLISLVLFAMLGWMAVAAYRQHGWKVVTLSPVLIMFIMNDRFINLNPYPYLLWVLFFALSARPEAAPLAATRPPAAGRMATVRMARASP